MTELFCSNHLFHVLLGNIDGFTKQGNEIWNRPQLTRFTVSKKYVCRCNTFSCKSILFLFSGFRTPNMFKSRKSWILLLETCNERDKVEIEPLVLVFPLVCFSFPIITIVRLKIRFRFRPKIRVRQKFRFKQKMAEFLAQTETPSILII